MCFGREGAVIKDLSGLKLERLIVDDLNWLMEWYASQCDGDWEHSYGIELGTLDNPGWNLTIDLEYTHLEACPFTKVEYHLMSDVSWWRCEVKDKKFLALCGPKDLMSILAIFRVWSGKQS